MISSKKNTSGILRNFKEGNKHLHLTVVNYLFLLGTVLETAQDDSSRCCAGESRDLRFEHLVVDLCFFFAQRLQVSVLVTV